ncbi:MAG: cupin domain-containing protein [Chloroflexi bacterium]|nr:cupin domain-containing protein [Chloroflexota bacterium]
MTTKESYTADKDLPVLHRVEAYQTFIESEGIPIVTGFFVEDLNTLPLKPWARVGGNGAYVNLDGNGGTNDAYVCEIPPGKSLNPERHMFEKLIYVLSGRGATALTQGEREQTFEWGPGAVFSIPVNAPHQHHNGSGAEPVRFVAVTSAPMVMSIFNSTRFVFDNPFEFEERYTSEQYNTGDGTLWQSTTGRHVWETNFVPDVVNFKLFDLPRRGAGGSNVTFELGYNSLASHISQFPVGTYKKAHWHGPGAHVFILSGQGYSLLWPKDAKRTERTRVDWKPGSLVVPPNEWFHQHFNGGASPARYLALRWGSHRFSSIAGITPDTEGADKSIEEGGSQIEYEIENPAVLDEFEEECLKHGATPQMRGFFPDRKSFTVKLPA